MREWIERIPIEKRREIRWEKLATNLLYYISGELQYKERKRELGIQKPLDYEIRKEFWKIIIIEEFRSKTKMEELSSDVQSLISQFLYWESEKNKIPLEKLKEFYFLK